MLPSQRLTEQNDHQLLTVRFWPKYVNRGYMVGRREERREGREEGREGRGGGKGGRGWKARRREGTK